MSAAQYDLHIDRGEDYNFTLRVLDAFEDPIDFVGSDFIAEIREAYKKPLIASFSTTSMGDGCLKLELSDTQTKLLSPILEYRWDLFWTQSGKTTKLLYGKVNTISNISNL